jgi:hypothetical protein
MAGSPPYKIYSGLGVYQGSVKEPEAAAVLVSFYGTGSTVRLGHHKKGTIWTESMDQGYAEMYDGIASKDLDHASKVMLERVEDSSRRTFWTTK